MGNRRCPPPPTPTGASLLPLSNTALPFPRQLLFRSQVPLRGLEVWATPEDMARGPDNVRKWSTLALLAIMGTVLTAATSPGIVAMITQKGLDFGNWMPFFLSPFPRGTLRVHSPLNRVPGKLITLLGGFLPPVLCRQKLWHNLIGLGSVRAGTRRFQVPPDHQGPHGPLSAPSPLQISRPFYSLPPLLEAEQSGRGGKTSMPCWQTQGKLPQVTPHARGR